MQSCAIGERLREQREQLGLNQEELGHLGGVNRNTQGKYEKGERNPDSAYLSAVAAAGLDVLYVITGERKPMSVDGITADEAELLGYYRSMPKSDRQTTVRMAFALAKASAPK